MDDGQVPRRLPPPDRYPSALRHGALRRGGRAVECGGLENRFTSNGRNEGSNPSPSVNERESAELQAVSSLMGDSEERGCSARDRSKPHELAHDWRAMGAPAISHPLLGTATPKQAVGLVNSRTLWLMVSSMSSNSTLVSLGRPVGVRTTGLLGGGRRRGGWKASERPGRQVSDPPGQQPKLAPAASTRPHTRRRRTQGRSGRQLTAATYDVIIGGEEVCQ